MEDLDSLLEDLARGKSSTSSNGNSTVKKVTNSRPVSSRVDLNELEDLMEDLAAPTAKQTPQPVSKIFFFPFMQSSHQYLFATRCPQQARG